MKINDLLVETYINLIGDDPRKDDHKQAVYDILQRSYSEIGGLKGSGTESPDALKELPMWKLAKRDGKIVAAVLYKDTKGRKSVAIGTDGSQIGLDAMTDITKSEPNRAYAEKSKRSLNFFMKTVDNAEQYIVPLSRVKKIKGGDSIIPFNSVAEKDWPINADERESTEYTIRKYPQLKDYGYFRKIGNEYFFKVMVGTPGIPLKK